jgi:glycosyltransferase involved in cell wall biosynthesis
MSLSLDASVIVATYNQFASTKLALRALFAQRTDCAYEILVCDDGSDGETVSALIRMLELAPVPARLVWQQDRGFHLSASRNNAIGMAKGRILIFLDGDLVPEEDFVETHLRSHADAKTIAVGRRLWRNPEAIKGKHWQVRDLWHLLRGTHAIDDKSKIVEAISTMAMRSAYKSRPWASIQGCNFSVTNSSLVGFDEAMIGWGFEDIDLAYGLTTVHGFEIRQVDSSAYDVLGWVDHARTWQQSDYVAHLLNGLRFLENWAHKGLSAQNALPKHTLDPETGLWSMTPLHRAGRHPINNSSVTG